MNFKSLDIFCDIIDNYGDIGVVYRLAKEMKEIYKENIEVRVFLNRVDEFLCINKRAKNEKYQKLDGITYITYDFLEKNIYTITPANVIIEAFGCNIYSKYLKKAEKYSKLIINLEYLSGEEWAETAHLMESPTGTALKKYFFMPGFNEKTGGIIVDSLYINRKEKVKRDREKYIKKYLEEIREDEFIGTIFSYEKNFEPLIKSLKKNNKKNRLLILGEKSQKSFKYILEKENARIIGKNLFQIANIKIQYMPFLNQEEYEELINISHYNFVRGEDSFVRSLLTGVPFIWHIYLQENMEHMNKIDGFLRCFNDYFRNDEKYVDILNTLLRDYNFRDKNSFEIGKENFDDFFSNYEEIRKISEKYSEYLISKCNLIYKLNNFIKKY